MKNPTAFRLLGICVSLLAAGVWSVLASGPAAPVVSGPSDLAEELRDAQFLAPPCVGLLDYDAGEFVFVPDGTDPDAEWLAKGLVSARDGTRETIWPVVLFEDPATRETVFENALGDEILRLPAEIDYSPAWVLASLYPGGGCSPGEAVVFDPSRIVMNARLRAQAPWVFSDERVVPNNKAPELRRGDDLKKVVGTTSLSHSALGIKTLEQSGGQEVASVSSSASKCGGVACENATLFVDTDVGSDLNDGLAAEHSAGARGPMGSLRQAFHVAERDAVIEIRGQRHLPDTILNGSGKRLRLRPMGVVRF